jgi:hypothetical protein
MDVMVASDSMKMFAGAQRNMAGVAVGSVLKAR